MKKLLHWIKFHAATPKDYPDGAFNAEDNMIGAVVMLKDDPKEIEYEVLRSGPISRGPMRQLTPSISFLCRKPMFGYEDLDKKYYDYSWFRKDSLKFVR